MLNYNFFLLERRHSSHLSRKKWLVPDTSCLSIYFSLAIFFNIWKGHKEKKEGMLNYDFLFYQTGYPPPHFPRKYGWCLILLTGQFIFAWQFLFVQNVFIFLSNKRHPPLPPPHLFHKKTMVRDFSFSPVDLFLFGYQ